MAIASLLIAVLLIIALLLTQDFTQQMAIFDAWSPLFIVAGVANVVLAVMYWRRDKRRDNDDGAAPAPAAA